MVHGPFPLDAAILSTCLLENEHALFVEDR